MCVAIIVINMRGTIVNNERKFYEFLSVGDLQKRCLTEIDKGY